MSSLKQKKFLELYKPIHDRFERFCRARAYADMPYEDLINETLLIAYQKMNEIKKQTSFLSYLIGISIRILANSRKKHKALISEDEFVLKNFQDPENLIEKQFEVEMLHQALAMLPDQQRESLILFEIVGFSIKEIMDLQNSSESAVKQRLARGRKGLYNILNEERILRKEGTDEA